MDFIYEGLSTRVIFGIGKLKALSSEVSRLGSKALVLCTPEQTEVANEAARILGDLAVGIYDQAAMHVPVETARAAQSEAVRLGADVYVAIGGGSTTGLGKAIALEFGHPIVCVPTTYAGSEMTPIWGLTEGGVKRTGRDMKVLPRTVIYDPELTVALPPAVTAASAMNAIAHCVEGLWVPERTPVTAAYATEAMRRFGAHLPRAVANGADMEARGECLVAAWLAGTVLVGGTGLHHKLAHVLGGYGLPHAETHAIILPHVARFNLAAAPDARARLADALGHDDPAAALAEMVQKFPIPQRLRDVGFAEAKIDDAAGQVAALAIEEPRPVSAEDARAILKAAL